MTELSALNIKITGDESGLTSALNSARGQLQTFGGAVDQAQAGVNRLPATMGRASAAASALSANSKQLSWQLSQVVQQGTATGQWAQAFAIQLGDIVPLIGAGGLIGAGVSALAMIGLPLLANAFTGVSAETQIAAEKAERLKAAYDALAESTTNAQATIDQLRFGVDEEYQAELLREQIRLRDEYNLKVAQLNGYLATTTDSLDRQRVTTSELQADISRIASAYNANAAAIKQQQDRMTQLAIIEGVRAQRAGEAAAKIRDEQARVELMTQRMTAAMNAFSGAASSAAGAVSAIGNAATASYGAVSALANELLRAASARAEMIRYGGDDERGSQRPQVHSAAGFARDNPRVGGGGGGGGGGGRDLAGELEAFRQSLATEAEMELEQYAQRQTALREFLDARLLTQQEYAGYMEELQQQHQIRMSEIDAWRYGDGLAKAQAFSGAMADALQSGGEKMQRVARGFAAVEALINAWRAYSQTLADPSLPFLAKFAAAAKVLAAGMGAVNAIKGSGSGAGGGASTSAAGSAASGGGSPLQVNLNTYGMGDFISRADFGSMLDRLNQVAGDRGYTIMVPA